jgi:hypothetical protein
MEDETFYLCQLNLEGKKLKKKNLEDLEDTLSLRNEVLRVLKSAHCAAKKWAQGKKTGLQHFMFVP